MRPLLPAVLLATSVLSGCATHLTDSDFALRVDPPLSPAATSILRSKDLVISTSPSIPSFHLGYTAVFKAHAPLYFTADSLLHALHRSYDTILANLEREVLSTELETLLTELRQGLARDTKASAEARAEVDFFLAVAESLLQGKTAAPVAGASQEDVTAWTARAASEGDCGNAHVDSMPPPPSAEARVYGDWPLKSIARMDLSMLKPRGHYTQSLTLCRYFQAMMWLGRAELRLAEYDKSARRWQVARPALDAVLILDSLLSGRAEQSWRRIDDTTSAFVGPPDSMSFPGLRRAARARGLTTVAALATLTDAELAEALQAEAGQRISSSLGLRSEPGHEPIGFLVLGQRYVFDSEVLSSVSYGRLPQKRMMPSPLDVGWAALRNPAALTLLEPELKRHGYRDALDAATRRGDEAGAALWEGSLYHLWLGALRGLSPDPARDGKLPPLMRSEAWGRRMLNSQLASWAELRHDTLLYAKQSFSAIAVCEFPSAYVDPYPAFYRALEKLAVKGSALVEGLTFKDSQSKKRVVKYFEHLGEVSFTLREIAEREQQGLELTSAQLDFMNHAVSVNGKQAGCTRVLEASGWYADLYFNRDDVLSHEDIVADVHTQPTEADGAPVGKVLHVGTGHPRLMTVTLDTGSGPRTYRGFVSSYFEKTTRDFQRLSDVEWRWGRNGAGLPEPRNDVPWLRGLIAP